MKGAKRRGWKGLEKDEVKKDDYFYTSCVEISM